MLIDLVDTWRNGMWVKIVFLVTGGPGGNVDEKYFWWKCGSQLFFLLNFFWGGGYGIRVLLGFGSHLAS